MYRPVPRSSSRCAVSEARASPSFRVRTPDPVLTCLDISCLPESSSPDLPVSFEQRLALKFQASQRHIEDLRQRKKRQEAQLMRDRPFVSQRSKVLAYQAEERFWKQHAEKGTEREPVVLLEVGREQKPPRPVPKPSQPKPLSQPSYTSLKDRIRSFLRTNEKDKATPRSPIKPTASSEELKHLPKSTTRLKSARRPDKPEKGDRSYRSISPASVNVSFIEGCDFKRLIQDRNELT